VLQWFRNFVRFLKVNIYVREKLKHHCPQKLLQQWRWRDSWLPFHLLCDTVELLWFIFLHSHSQWLHHPPQMWNHIIAPAVHQRYANINKLNETRVDAFFSFRFSCDSSPTLLWCKKWFRRLFFTQCWVTIASCKTNNYIKKIELKANMGKLPSFLFNKHFIFQRRRTEISQRAQRIKSYNKFISIIPKRRLLCPLLQFNILSARADCATIDLNNKLKPTRSYWRRCMCIAPPSRVGQVLSRPRMGKRECFSLTRFKQQ
jgi:hypothetical protein